MTIDEAISESLGGILAATQLELQATPESEHPRLMAKRQVAAELLRRLEQSPQPEALAFRQAQECDAEPLLYRRAQHR